MTRWEKLVFTCFAPLSDPGNHGDDPSNSLQIAPFRTEGNSIWIGYHDQPSRKYLGVFPSFEEVVNRCRNNASAGGANTYFPRFRTDVRVRKGVVRESTCSRNLITHASCAGYQDIPSHIQGLTLKFLPVETNDKKYTKVFLVVYRFYLRGESMVALLHHTRNGKYCFQKTDGTLSRMLALDSRQRRLNEPPSGSLQENDDGSDTSSLTEFDFVDGEDTTDVRKHFEFCISWSLTSMSGSRFTSYDSAIQPTPSASRVGNHHHETVDATSTDSRISTYASRIAHSTSPSR
jgi:hypothetical protein